MHYWMETDSACAFDNLVDRRADIAAQNSILPVPRHGMRDSMTVTLVSDPLACFG
jgi:hypothetical protein